MHEAYGWPGAAPAPPIFAFQKSSPLLPMPRYLMLGLMVGVLLAACEAPSEEADPDHAAFVTRLGADTVVVEQFVYQPNRIEAQAVVRVPETRVHRYVLETAPDGSVLAFEDATLEAGDRPEAAPVRIQRAALEGDSLVLTGEPSEGGARRIAAEGTVAPFLDMLHWPFEHALRHVYATGADSATVMLFTGRGTRPFVIRRLAPDSMTITHPTRGTMGVTVDGEGRLLRLDAGATTRKLVVERVPDVDLRALADDFAARDAAGQPFRALSGRGEASATVDGATITVDYGVPRKRGREIFGALVPWNERWRTGANRATHFTTDRALAFGDLEVPAGEYTLYSIPAPDGGTLIINRQTGQGGTSYDEAQDLGRVPMQITERPESAESFTIEVEDTAEGGALVLWWDRTAFRIPFTVR